MINTIWIHFKQEVCRKVCSGNTISKAKLYFLNFTIFHLFLIFLSCTKCCNCHAKSYFTSDKNCLVRLLGEYITRIPGTINYKMCSPKNKSWPFALFFSRRSSILVNAADIFSSIAFTESCIASIICKERHHNINVLLHFAFTHYPEPCEPNFRSQVVSIDKG